MLNRCLKVVAPAFVFLLVLTACSTGSPVDVNNELWKGTSQSRGGNGTTLTATVGFKQTGNEVRAKWAFNRPGSLDIIFIPTMTGTISGSAINISSTDSVGDSGTFQGRFDGSGQSLTGTLTISTSATQLVIDINATYDQPLRDNALVNPQSNVRSQGFDGSFRKLLE